MKYELFFVRSKHFFLMEIGKIQPLKLPETFWWHFLQIDPTTKPSLGRSFFLIVLHVQYKNFRDHIDYDIISSLTLNQSKKCL